MFPVGILVLIRLRIVATSLPVALETWDAGSVGSCIVLAQVHPAQYYLPFQIADIQSLPCLGVLEQFTTSGSVQNLCGICFVHVHVLQLDCLWYAKLAEHTLPGYFPGH